MNDLNKIKNYCAKREVCIFEAKNKLFSWGIDEQEANNLIKLLLKEKFIDEKRYSVAYVNDHYKIKKWGKNKIKSALISKKINSNTIHKAIEKIDEKIYAQNLITILENKAVTIKSQNSTTTSKEKDKLIRHAMSKGYEFDFILTCLTSIKHT